MLLPLDYRELLSILNRHKVKYLIVGAYAVIHYTEPRYTKDLDIWIEPTKINAFRVYQALEEFGAPLKGIERDDFTNLSLVYQMGVAPVRIDIIMGLGKLKFSSAWRKRVRTSYEGVPVNIIGIKELIKVKRKTKRPLDAADIENLKLRLRKVKRKQ